MEFLCPSGHRIHCSDDQAGHAAKCPQCGVKFRIPDPSEVELLDAADDSEVSRPELTDSDTPATPPQNEPGKQDQTPDKEKQIEFLCPNGHRLHGSASLQGRPGQCPDCGSRFRIPVYDDVPEEEEGQEQQISLGRAGGGEDPTRDIQKTAPQALSLDTPESATAPSQRKSDRTAAGHPLAGLFSRLWAEKPKGATIQLQLAGGETLLPELFNKTLSRHDHAVFAVKDPDGSYTLTAVAWESIVRVMVRGVKQLPDGMSD